MTRYFFGFWSVPEYDYNWVHTKAQLELIFIDQPITVFEKSKDVKPGQPGYKPNARKLREATEKWKKRKAEREKRGFDLNKFLRTGEKVSVDNKEQGLL